MINLLLVIIPFGESQIPLSSDISIRYKPAGTFVIACQLCTVHKNDKKDNVSEQKLLP